MSWNRPLTRARQSIRNTVARGLSSTLLAGTALTPAAAQMLVGDGSVTCGDSYAVESGDSLSRISESAYGDPQLYGFIADANWGAIGGNPENISVGMSLTIPCIDASGQVLMPEQAAEATASLEAAVATQGTLTPDQLDTLFGPVALFPDAVLTPVLVAITFPLDVVKAGRFVEESAELSDEERTDQAAEQDWDNSVKELAAAFPDLVTRMNDHIEWTEQAGEAVVAQTDDVLASIQRLRATAQENGYLVDNEAQSVEEEGDTIVISSTSPGVVYVPTYDPQVVYTTPAVGPPIYHYGYDYHDHDDWDGWGDALVAGGIILGGAIILDEIFDDDDWDGWDPDDDIDWDRGDITIDRGDIDIERGDINIDRGDRGDINIGGGDRGDISIGNGDRPGIGDGDRQIGDGGRVSIGDSDRPQIDRDALAERVGGNDRPRADTLPGNRTPISSSASREVARQKIEARQATGVRPATLRTSSPQGGRSSAGTGRANLQPTRLGAPRSASASSRAVQNRSNFSRPSSQLSPTVRSSSRSSSAFQRPSGRHRAAASANRGHRSRGGGGGRRGR